MTVRVVIVHPGHLDATRPGGIQSFIRSFIKFAPGDFELDHVGTSADRETPLGRWTDASIAGRAVRFLPLVRATPGAGAARVPIALRFTAALYRARTRIRSNGAVLQFHRPGTALPLFGLRAARIQVVHLPAADLVSPHSESRWRSAAWALRLVEWRTLPRMDRVIVVNEAAAQAYRRRFPELAARVEFLSNWVDDSIFRPLAGDEKAAAREALVAAVGAEPTDRILLFAGRLDEQKQPLALLDAIRKISDGAVKLLIVGDGRLRQRVDEMIAAGSLGERVRRIGFATREELARLMNGADLLVISSSHETGPTVAFEALACGLPVVGPPVGRLPALLERGGGVIARDGSGSNLAVAVKAALRSDLAEMRTAAVGAAQPYAAHRVLAGFYEMHRELAAVRR